MRQRIIHFLARMPAGVLRGVGAGALYAGLVSAIQISVSWSWDRAPACAVACVAAGGLFLLLLGIASVLAGETSPDSRPPPAVGHSPVPAGSRGGNRRSQAPLGMSAGRSDSAGSGRPDSQHPRRAETRRDGSSQGTAWKPRSPHERGSS